MPENMVSASVSAVVGAADVSRFLNRNSLVIRIGHDSLSWRLFRRVEHLEQPIGDIDRAHQGSSERLLAEMKRLLSAVVPEIPIKE